MTEHTETHQKNMPPPAGAISTSRNGDSQPSSIAIEIATLRVHIDHILTAISNLNTRMDRLQDRLESGISDLRKEGNTRFYWLMGMMFGGFAAMLAAMARGFGWLS